MPRVIIQKGRGHELIRAQNLEARLKVGIKSIDDVVYRVNIKEAMNKHYSTQEYQIMMENKRGGIFIDSGPN